MSTLKTIADIYRHNARELEKALSTKEPQSEHARRARSNRIKALRWIVERLREVYGL